MNADDLKQVLQEFQSGQALLLDVREPAEWEHSHIKGAQLAPLSKIQLGELPDLPSSSRIYTYCRRGQRAVLAIAPLESKYAIVEPLCVSYEELVEAGFPTVTE